VGSDLLRLSVWKLFDHYNRVWMLFDLYPIPLPYASPMPYESMTLVDVSVTQLMNMSVTLPMIREQVI